RKVYKFTRNVVTGVNEPASHDPIHSVTVSPNPTPGKATVRITFGNPTMAHVHLYSTTGKVMKKIFDGPVAAGEKLIELDLSTQSDQAFLVIVKTNEGMISTRLMKR